MVNSTRWGQFPPFSFRFSKIQRVFSQLLLGITTVTNYTVTEFLCSHFYRMSSIAKLTASLLPRILSVFYCEYFFKNVQAVEVAILVNEIDKQLRFQTFFKKDISTPCRWWKRSHRLVLHLYVIHLVLFDCKTITLTERRRWVAGRRWRGGGGNR